MPLRLRYNAPVVLTFSLAAAGVMLLASVPGLSRVVPRLFTVGGEMHFADPLSYFRLVSHVLGHADWSHLLANLTVVLLVGPLLEEKYKSGPLAGMIAVTAFVTAVLNIALFDTGLLGASGVAFMMIVLGSLASFRRAGGGVPLTFVLVLLLFVGAEIARSFRTDSVSQFAHILGGLCGAAFGLLEGE